MARFYKQQIKHSSAALPRGGVFNRGTPTGESTGAHWKGETFQTCIRIRAPRRPWGRHPQNPLGRAAACCSPHTPHAARVPRGHAAVPLAPPSRATRVTRPPLVLGHPSEVQTKDPLTLMVPPISFSFLTWNSPFSPFVKS